MSKYYRNSKGVVAEFIESRNIWVSVENPSIEYSDENGTPGGFDDLPGMFVSREVVAVACVDSAGFPDIYFATVFVTDEEKAVGHHCVLAEAELASEGYDDQMVLFAGREHNLIIDAARKLIDYEEANDCQRICADLVELSDSGQLSIGKARALAERARKGIVQTNQLKNNDVDLVLAGLRLLQQSVEAGADLSTLGDTLDPAAINADGIDELCERLNNAGSEKEDLESYKTLVLSTAHMRFSDASVLESLAESDGMEHRVLHTQRGFQCRLYPDLYYREYDSRGLSDEIRAVFDFAVKRGFEAVEFDCDAYEIDGLPTFHW